MDPDAISTGFTILSFPPCWPLLCGEQEPSRINTCLAPLAQKYRLYLKRVQGVQPGSRGSSGAAPSMLHGHDSSLFSHGLGSSDQVRACAGLPSRLMGVRSALRQAPVQSTCGA